jgi:hypothetical protein
VDGDGDYDELYSYGARSFSIWTPKGRQLFDSGDELEQKTAEAYPYDFNSTDEENGSFDDRSDDKGPEPEGVAVGRAYGRTYIFVGLERIGGFAVYSVTHPGSPEFVQYINTRNFDVDAASADAGDISPEGLTFIKAVDSPTDRPLLVVSFEISGSTTVFEVRKNDHWDPH